MCNFRIAEDRPNPPSLGPTGFPYGQNGNEERIAKILSEANKAMAAGVAAAASKDSVVPITSAAGQVSFPYSGILCLNNSFSPILGTARSLIDFHAL